MLIFPKLFFGGDMTKREYLRLTTILVDLLKERCGNLQYLHDLVLTQPSDDDAIATATPVRILELTVMATISDVSNLMQQIEAQDLEGVPLTRLQPPAIREPIIEILRRPLRLRQLDLFESKGKRGKGKKIMPIDKMPKPQRKTKGEKA